MCLPTIRKGFRHVSQGPQLLGLLAWRLGRESRGGVVVCVDYLNFYCGPRDSGARTRLNDSILGGGDPSIIHKKLQNNFLQTMLALWASGVCMRVGQKSAPHHTAWAFSNDNPNIISGMSHSEMSALVTFSGPPI